jgi:hypothetical protein
VLDRVFKFALLVMFGVFLVLYWRQTQNGRYTQVEVGTLDTRTGATYIKRIGCEPVHPGCVDIVWGPEDKNQKK